MSCGIQAQVCVSSTSSIKTVLSCKCLWCGIVLNHSWKSSEIWPNSWLPQQANMTNSLQRNQSVKSCSCTHRSIILQKASFFSVLIGYEAMFSKFLPWKTEPRGCSSEKLLCNEIHLRLKFTKQWHLPGSVMS